MVLTLWLVLLREVLIFLGLAEESPSTSWFKRDEFYFTNSALPGLLPSGELFLVRVFIAFLLHINPPFCVWSPSHANTLLKQQQKLTQLCIGRFPEDKLQSQYPVSALKSSCPFFLSYFYPTWILPLSSTQLSI